MKPIQKKLSEKVCRSAKPGTKVWDTEIRGFGCWVSATGSKRTLYFQKTTHEGTKRFNLGQVGQVAVADARFDAGELNQKYATGVTAKRINHQEQSIPSLEEGMVQYLTQRRLSSSNRNATEGRLRLHLTDWMKLPLYQITPDMCVAKHAALSKKWEGVDTKGRQKMLGGERVANHVMMSLRTVHNFVRARHPDLPASPVLAVQMHEEQESGVTIEDPGLWRQAVDELQNPVHRSVYEFLLATGLRRGEAFNLRREHLYDDHLFLPVTKNGRSFKLPLLDIHHRILSPTLQMESEWVFPSKDHRKPLGNPAPIGWSAHTHRRTFGTYSALAIGDDLTGRLLNHTSKSITGKRYVKPKVEHMVPFMEQSIDSLQSEFLITRNV